MEKEIVTVNGVNIECPMVDGQPFVPIRPICDLLKLNFAAQFRRIKNDAILSSVVATVATTGADGKQYEMVCLPLKFIFGWLFSIDTHLVKPEALEPLNTYKLICYTALYDHFYLRASLYKKKDDMIKAAELRLLELQNALKLKKESYKPDMTMINKQRALVKELRSKPAEDYVQLDLQTLFNEI